MPVLVGITLVSGAAAETHIAAVTRNSVPKPSKEARNTEPSSISPGRFGRGGTPRDGLDGSLTATTADR